MVSHAVTLAEDWIKYRSSEIEFVVKLQRQKRLSANNVFRDRFKKLHKTDPAIVPPVYDFIMIYVAATHKDSTRKARAISALWAFLTARTAAEVTAHRVKAEQGALDVGATSAGGRAVEELPGYRRLSPDLQFDARGEPTGLGNQDYDKAWRELALLVAKAICYSPATGAEVTDVLASYVVPLGSPKHPLHQQQGETLADLMARQQRQFERISADLATLGASSRIPREDERVQSLINAVSADTMEALKATHVALPHAERSTGGECDLAYLSTLAREANKRETEFPQALKQAEQALLRRPRKDDDGKGGGGKGGKGSQARLQPPTPVRSATVQYHYRNGPESGADSHTRLADDRDPGAERELNARP